jgi:hypothetical protein
VKQTILLTEQGQKDYEALFELLQEFVDKKTPLDYILNTEKDDYGADDLYPGNAKK